MTVAYNSEPKEQKKSAIIFIYKKEKGSKDAK
jgi:hypothetical protein